MLLPAVRLIRNNWRLYAVALFGLTVGMIVALATLLLTQHELSYETWIPDYDRIVRIENEVRKGRGIPPTRLDRSPAVALPYLLSDLSRIQLGARAIARQAIVKRDGDVRSLDALIVDSDFFDVFGLRSRTIKQLGGDSSNPLSDVTSIVLTSSAAKQIFAGNDALGQTLALRIGGQLWAFRIAAVIADVPDKSHLAFQALIPLRQEMFAEEPWVFREWNANSALTYVKLSAPTPADEINLFLRGFQQTRTPGFSAQEALAGEPTSRLLARSVRDIHLSASGRGGLKQPGNSRLVVTLGIVGVGILLISLLNYVNLTMAVSMQRAPSLGMKAILGATWIHHLRESLLEAMLIAVCAAALSSVMTIVLWPWVQALLGIQVPWSIAFLANVLFLGSIMGLTFAVFTGVANALVFTYVARQSAVVGRAMRVVLQTRAQAALLFLQLLIAICLIAGAMIVYTQAAHLAAVDVGLNKSQLFTLAASNPSKPRRVSDAAMEEFRHIENISGVARALVAPGIAFAWTVGTERNSSDDGRRRISLEVGFIDQDYFTVLQIPTVAGRVFSRDFPTDDSTGRSSELLKSDGISVVIDTNAAAALDFSSPQDAVGKRLWIDHWQQLGDKIPAVIVGVVASHRLRAIATDREPARLYVIELSWANNILLRLAANASIQSSFSSLRTTWDKFFPDEPVKIDHVDAMYARMTEPYFRLGRGLAAGGIAAAAVALAGLVGLVAFLVRRDRRRLTIHSILGAGNLEIAAQVLRPLLFAIVGAALLAPVIIQIVLKSWLSSFPTVANGVGLVSIIPVLLVVVIVILIVWRSANQIATADDKIAMLK